MATLMEMGQTLASSGFYWVYEVGGALMTVSVLLWKIKTGDHSVVEDVKDIGGQVLTYSGITGQVASIYAGIDWKWLLSFLATIVGLWLTRQALKERKRANDLKERELNQKLEESNQ